MSSSSNPDHMPWSSLKWTGNEREWAAIAAASRRRSDEQSRIWLQEDFRKVKDEAKCSQATMQSKIEDLQKEVADLKVEIAEYKKLDQYFL